MSPPVDETLLSVLSIGAVVLTLGLAAVVLTRFSDSESPHTRLQERFVYGIPWGTVLVVGGVYAIYYLVQGGGDEGGPIITAFRSWSLWYPQGTLFSSFAHASESHLQSNLLATVAFAPLVEYVWGHYASGTQKGDSNEYETRLLSRPAGRIGVFVGGVVGVGLLGSIFVPGAIIGFSGVVFAFAGFALVVRPLLAIGAILGLRVLRLLVSAIQDPVLIATAEPRFVTPSWANTALQGHLFGLLVGVLLAVLLLRLRNEQPAVPYVWFAVLVFAVTRSMDAIYWYLGADEYVLYQALGTAGVIGLASLVALSVYTGEQRLRSGTGKWPLLSRRPTGLPVRTVAVGLLVIVFGLIAVSGLAYSITPVSPGDDIDNAEEQITVSDYTVTYAEGVEDQYIGAVRVPGLWEPSVTVDGVVVTSDDRNVWELAVSSNRLAFDGRATIPLGDVTWRETVYVDRTQWEFVDGNSTYKVFGRHEDRDWKRLYADSPAVSKAVVDGANVSIEPADEFYDVVLQRDGDRVGSAKLPTEDGNVTVDGVTFDRIGNDLVVRHDETEFTIARFAREEG